MFYSRHSNPIIGYIDFIPILLKKKKLTVGSYPYPPRVATSVRCNLILQIFTIITKNKNYKCVTIYSKLKKNLFGIRKTPMRAAGTDWRILDLN
jgi:hypothetical protein